MVLLEDHGIQRFLDLGTSFHENHTQFLLNHVHHTQTHSMFLHLPPCQAPREDGSGTCLHCCGPGLPGEDRTWGCHTRHRLHRGPNLHQRRYEMRYHFHIQRHSGCLEEHSRQREPQGNSSILHHFPWEGVYSQCHRLQVQRYSYGRGSQAYDGHRTQTTNTRHGALRGQTSG